MAIFSRNGSEEETSRAEDSTKHSSWDQPLDLGDTDLLNDDDITMTMEDIDKLFDDNELNRLLNEDVDDFILSSDFQDLLNAKDIDDILSLYHKDDDEKQEDGAKQDLSPDNFEEESQILDEEDPFRFEPEESDLSQPEEVQAEISFAKPEDNSGEETKGVRERKSDIKVQTERAETTEDSDEFKLDESFLENRFSFGETESFLEKTEGPTPSFDEEPQPKHEESGTGGMNRNRPFKLEITQEVQAAVYNDEPVAQPKPRKEKASGTLQKESVSSEDFTESVSERPKKKSRYAALGIFLTLFAIIGIIAFGVWGYHTARGLLNQTDAKKEFNDVVYPLVVVDVPEFDSVDKLDSKVVVAAGIWNFLMNETNMGKYEQDEMGSLTVPAVDIEVYIRQLFGSNVQIEHQQISDFEFYYDPETELYQIPASPQVLPYAPSVQSVVHTGTDYVVEVGYILPGPFWNVGEYAADGEINKMMVYHYKKDQNGNYIIQSVERDPDTVVSEIEDDVSYPDGYANEESNVSSEDDGSEATSVTE